MYLPVWALIQDAVPECEGWTFLGIPVIVLVVLGFLAGVLLNKLVHGDLA